MLNNREIVSLTLILVLILVTVRPKKLWITFLPLIRSVFALKLSAVYLAFIGYVVLVIWFARICEIWNHELLHDTLSIVLLIGFPMLVRAGLAEDATSIMCRGTRETLSFSTLLIFYLNFSTLSLFGEFLIQILLFCSLLVSLVASMDGAKNQQVATFFQGLSITIGFGLLIFSGETLIHNWPVIDHQFYFLSLAVTIWLPLMFLPFLYLVSFYAASEKAIIMMKFKSGSDKTSLTVKLAIVMGFRWKSNLAKNFLKYNPFPILNDRSYKEVREFMKEYRQSQTK